MEKLEAVPVSVDIHHKIQCACGKKEWCVQVTPCTNLVLPQQAAILGTEGFKSMLELEDHLMANGGQIVNVDLLTAYELAEVRVNGHLLIDEKGKGFAWMADKESCA